MDCGILKKSCSKNCGIFKKNCYYKAKRIEYENIRLKNELKFLKAKIKKCESILLLKKTKTNRLRYYNKKTIAVVKLACTTSQPTAQPEMKEESENRAHSESEELAQPEIKEESENRAHSESGELAQPEIKKESENRAHSESGELAQPEIKEESENRAHSESGDLAMFETREAYINNAEIMEERLKHLEKEFISLQEKKASEIQVRDKKITFLQNSVTSLKKEMVSIKRKDALEIQARDEKIQSLQNALMSLEEKQKTLKGKGVKERKSLKLQKKILHQQGQSQSKSTKNVVEESPSKVTDKLVIDLKAGPVEQMQMLFKDTKNHGPNKEIAFHLMNQTFTKRRAFIFEQYPKVFEVKELYPWMFSFDGLQNELNRIYNYKTSDFLSNVNKYCDRILNVSVDPLKESVLAIANVAESQKQKKHILETGSLLLLPRVLKEDCLFVRFNTDEKPDPYTGLCPYIRAPPSCKEVTDLLTHEGRYQVIVDTIVTCETETLAKALLALFACLFIFNIQYDSKYHNTCIIIEKLFLDINETWHISDCVKEVMKVLTRVTA